MAAIDSLLTILRSQGISHPRVIAALKQIPREKFIAKIYQKQAYENKPLPIENLQTISQPYIVALMTEILLHDPIPSRVLEIGTGSGYQTAILATLFDEIWTIERINTLSKQAQKILHELGFKNIHFKWGDGYKGWPARAPFDAIIVTAAAENIPENLLNQLSPTQGKLLIPIGPQNEVQKLTLIERQGDHFSSSFIENVCFVPMIAKT